MSAAHFRITVPGDAAAGRHRLEYRLGADGAQDAATLEPVWMGAPGLPRPPEQARSSGKHFRHRPMLTSTS